MIDAVPTAAAIDNALARLEAIARNRGIAVGAASALPITIGRIAEWAKAAERARHPAGAGQHGGEPGEDGKLASGARPRRA